MAVDPHTIGLLLRFVLMWAVRRAPALGSQLGQAAWGYVFLAGAALFRNRADHFADVDVACRWRAVDAKSAKSGCASRVSCTTSLRNVSLINVQASTALHLIEAEPERARTALAAIEASHEDIAGAPSDQAPCARWTRMPHARRQLAWRESTSWSGGRQRLLRTLYASVTLTDPATAFHLGRASDRGSLTNVRRHAGVDEASVTLTYRPHEPRYRRVGCGGRNREGQHRCGRRARLV